MACVYSFVQLGHSQNHGQEKPGGGDFGKCIHSCCTLSALLPCYVYFALRYFFQTITVHLYAFFFDFIPNFSIFLFSMSQVSRRIWKSTDCWCFSRTLKQQKCPSSLDVSTIKKCQIFLVNRSSWEQNLHYHLALGYLYNGISQG